MLVHLVSILISFSLLHYLDYLFNRLSLPFISSHLKYYSFINIYVGMIRSGAMLMGTAIQRCLFSRQFIYEPEWGCFCTQMVWLASLFNEEMRAGTRHLHPFSIQHLMETGEQSGKLQGRWFAPSTIAFVFKQLISKYAEQQLGLSVFFCVA